MVQTPATPSLPIKALPSEEGGRSSPFDAAWTVKVTSPPMTGWSGLSALKRTSSGCANSVPVPADWGVPVSAVRFESLALDGADIGIRRIEGLTAPVGGQSVKARCRSDGRAAGQQSYGLRRSAVVAKGCGVRGSYP